MERKQETKTWFKRSVAGVFALVALFCFSPRVAGERPTKNDSKETPVSVSKDIFPFLRRNCVSCHNDVNSEAKRSLTDYQDEKSIRKDRDLWGDIIKMVENKSMPPANHTRQPSAEDVERFVKNAHRILQSPDPKP